MKRADEKEWYILQRYGDLFAGDEFLVECVRKDE